MGVPLGVQDNVGQAHVFTTMAIGSDFKSTMIIYNKQVVTLNWPWLCTYLFTTTGMEACTEMVNTVKWEKMAHYKF